MNKAIRIKLFELGKTTSKKATPDMSNFYVVMAGHDIVTDASRATTWRRKIKASSSQTKSTKNEGPPKTWVLRGKSFEDFRQKKGNNILDLSKNPVEKENPERVI